MVMVHDIMFIVTFAMFLIHVYLAVVHPMMWQGLVSMRDGSSRSPTPAHTTPSGTMARSARSSSGSRKERPISNRRAASGDFSPIPVY